MSLLGWLGAAEPRKVDPRSLSPVKPARPERIVFGVLGSRNSVRYEVIENDVLGPILTKWGEPEEIILALDSDSAYIIHSWAERRGIPVRIIAADWVKHGSRAGVLRDACIQREASHLILLQGPRSNALSQLAGRLSRKGRNVVISPRPGEPVKSLDT
jgi:hypothetical protein